MADRRKKNASWFAANEKGETLTWGEAQIAVLMDIRDELQAIRGRLDCFEMLSIPRLLREIRTNTSKGRRKKVVKLRRVA